MLNLISHQSGSLRTEAVVGDVLDFSTAQIGGVSAYLGLLNIIEQPEGADTAIEASTITVSRPGVYRLSCSVNVPNVRKTIEVFVFPREALLHPQLQVDSAQRPKFEPDKRLVLRSVANHATVESAMAILPTLGETGWPAQLVGGRAGESLSLQPYGGVHVSR